MDSSSVCCEELPLENETETPVYLSPENMISSRCGY